MIRLFRVFIPTSVLGLLLSEFILIFLCYIAAAFIFPVFIPDPYDPQMFLFSEHGFFRIGIIVASIMAGIYFHNLYAQLRIRSRIQLVEQLCLTVGIACFTQAFLVYVKRPDWAVPRYLMIFGSALTLLLLPAWRIFYGNVVMAALGFQRLLFLGTSQTVRDIGAHLLDHPEAGMLPIGYVDNIDPETDLPGGRWLGCMEDLNAVVENYKPDRIVVGLSERRQQLPVMELLALRLSGLHIEEAFNTYETTFGRVSTRELRPSQLIFSAKLGPRRGSLFFHSAYSTIVAVFLVVVFAPIMALVAILVKLSSKGPILHRQTRVGLYDAPFTVYKFRSMYADAELRTGAVWAQKDDPRITPLGKWLRRLRLDELPQLLNVLRGEMAMVGPRPERPEFVKTLVEQIPYYGQRHCVKPGITGWAQINHKYGDTLQDTIIKLEFDLYYIKNLAFSLDTYIMFHTLRVMLFSDTAQ
ncbi:MAG: sugar transferase [Bryobacteraceae bacterium]